MGVAIDAKGDLLDNPLPRINGARTAAQRRRVNVRALQERGHIFCETTRRVRSGEELLLDYGSNYWSGLRYNTRLAELQKDVRRLRASLRSDPKPHGRKHEEIKEQLASTLEEISELADDLDD